MTSIRRHLGKHLISAEKLDHVAADQGAMPQIASGL
jgi:hypothetical protein